MRSSEQSLLFLETGLILAMSWLVSHPGNLPLPLPSPAGGRVLIFTSHYLRVF